MSATLGDETTVSTAGDDLPEVAVRVAEYREVPDMCVEPCVRWNT